MKTWIKQGLGLLAGLTFSAVAAAASEPIKDRDAFEKQYIPCMKSGFKDDCFLSLFLRHTVSNIQNKEETMKKVNVKLKERFTNFRVYDVHVLDKVTTGGITERRTYILEREGDGDVIACRVIFRKTLGEWYVFSFQWNESEENLRKLLNLDHLGSE
jgi:hypothetical protein